MAMVNVSTCVGVGGRMLNQHTLAPDGTDQEQAILRVNKIKYQF